MLNKGQSIITEFRHVHQAGPPPLALVAAYRIDGVIAERGRLAARLDLRRGSGGRGSGLG